MSGPLVGGFVGAPDDKRLDVYGATLNTAAMVAPPDRGFAMTPQVLRKLRPETRALSKKHTPPVTYVRVAARQ